MTQVLRQLFFPCSHMFGNSRLKKSILGCVLQDSSVPLML